MGLDMRPMGKPKPGPESGARLQRVPIFFLIPNVAFATRLTTRIM